MPNIRFHFEGRVDRLFRIGNAMGLPAARRVESLPEDNFSLTFEGDARDLKTVLADTGLFLPTSISVIGAPLKAPEPQCADSEVPVAEEEVTITKPHDPEDVKKALQAAAQEDADEKKAKAAAKRQAKAAAKREEDAQSRIAATVSEAQASEESDPNGATLAALLTQDTEAEIPEIAATEDAADDDGLADLLGESSEDGEDPKVALRAELAKLPDTDLTKRIRDVLGVKGAPWFKALLANIGKANLAKMTREEIIEVLVQEG